MVAMISTSLRNAASSRVQDSEMADSLPLIKFCLIIPKRAGKGVASPPDNEAKTDDISPSFFAPCSRVVAVARVLKDLLMVLVRTQRRMVHSITGFLGIIEMMYNIV